MAIPATMTSCEPMITILSNGPAASDSENASSTTVARAALLNRIQRPIPPVTRANAIPMWTSFSRSASAGTTTSRYAPGSIGTRTPRSRATSSARS